MISNFQAKDPLQSPVKKFSLDMEKVKQFDAMVDDAAAEVVEISLNNSGGARYSTLSGRSHMMSQTFQKFLFSPPRLQID